MCIENTAEAAMATKDQERGVLQQIKAMVAELGPDSYIATAFRGVFDIAEENIDNDFSGNPVEQAQDLGAAGPAHGAGRPAGRRAGRIQGPGRGGGGPADRP